MTTITITHREDGTAYQFKVKDPKNLTIMEVRRICKKMGVTALFVNGKYYAHPGPL